MSTPEELEKRVWGSQSVIQVEQINDSILAAVRKLSPQNLSIEENKIILMLADADREIPDYVKEVVTAGGRIQSVTKINPGLEETYIKVMEETK